MSLQMAGIDHTLASLDVRSVFSFTKKLMEQAYKDFLALPAIEGCVIISTCNRMEIWFSVSEEEELSPVSLICGFLHVDPIQYAPFFVERKEQDAVDHLFRLAAGLESRIVGEDQIITQVGDALAFARSCYATDHCLEVLFRLAVTAGKRIKTETNLSTADHSVIHAALRMLAEGGVTVTDRCCLVIGNGMMGRLAAQALLDHGAVVTVTVRQYRSGIVDIPPGCRRISYDERLSVLPDCDFVVSATSSPNYTLRYQDLCDIKPGHPVYMIDLAVPRDMEPEIASLDGFIMYDIDSFHIDLHSEKLRVNLARAEEILQEEQERFNSWYDCREFIPRIQDLKSRTGKDVGDRMNPFFRYIALHEDEKSDLRQEVEGAAARMMNHLLFSLRDRLTDREFRDCLDAMEKAFDE